MKKFFVMMVALVATAAMVAPAFAADNLTLSGRMDVRGFYYDVDDNGAEDSGAWNDQRLRIAGKFSVADSVSVNFRFDATESQENSSDALAWGNGSNFSLDGTETRSGATQYGQRRADIQFDKAYLQFDTGPVTVMAGQQYFRMGIGTMMDVVGAGFTFKVADLKLSHVKVADKNVGNDSFDGSTGAEASLTGAQYVIKAGDATITPMLTYMNIEGDGDRFGLGVNAKIKAGMATIKAEVNYMDGEQVNGLVDTVALQGYADAGFALSDTMTVGGMVVYAAGTDDANEEQITSMNESFNGIDYTFADFSPFTYGFNSTDFVAEIDAFEIDDNAGIVALQPYLNVKFTDDLAGRFAVAYAMAEEDTVADQEGIVLNASVKYDIATNTFVRLHVNYIDGTEDASTTGTGLDEDFEALQVVSGLYVKF